jgi:hypothetical protein
MNAKAGNEVKYYCLETGRWGILLAVFLPTRPSMCAFAQETKERMRIGFDVEMMGVMSEASMKVKMACDPKIRE